jgi:medium-chain acyl-[acyl-carrier-protein] hydrolase
MSNLQLYCFPYAGGSAMAYRHWADYLHPRVELRLIELSGRGKRIHEPLYADREEMIEDLLRRIRPGIIQGGYALFGHSMGAMIVYELVRRIKNEGLPAPLHCFFSGHGAPHITRPDEKKYHLMSDADFRREVMELGGTPPEIFEHSELMSLFLPMLRNDFRMVETGGGDVALRQLDTDITVFLGKDDDLTAQQCGGWSVQTRQNCHIHYFEGGHFFLKDHAVSVVDLINKVLSQAALDSALLFTPEHAKD